MILFADGANLYIAAPNKPKVIIISALGILFNVVTETKIPKPKIDKNSNQYFDTVVVRFQILKIL